MALIAHQKPTREGAATTYAAVSASDTTKCGDHVVAHVKNASAAAVTVTPTVRGRLGGHLAAIAATSVPAGGERFIGPLRGDLFSDVNGEATLAFSATASVTIAVLNIAE